MEYVKRRNGLGVFIYASVMILHGTLGIFWLLLGCLIWSGMVSPLGMGIHAESWPCAFLIIFLASCHEMTAWLCHRIVSITTEQRLNYLAAASLLASGIALTLCNSHYIAMNIISIALAVPLTFSMCSGKFQMSTL